MVTPPPPLVSFAWQVTQCLLVAISIQEESWVIALVGEGVSCQGHATKETSFVSCQGRRDDPRCFSRSGIN